MDDKLLDMALVPLQEGREMVASTAWPAKSQIRPEPAVVGYVLIPLFVDAKATTLIALDQVTEDGGEHSGALTSNW